MSLYTIAYFITPHGFGHATRAAAVMQALSEIDPRIRFELFTTCPIWIFEDSLAHDFGYHNVLTDIGMVQKSPLEEDPWATGQKLDEMLPFSRETVHRLAAEIKRLNCRLVICDIAPMGIAVARAAGLDSVLVENFTWDWIYQGYIQDAPQLTRHVDYLADIYRQADHHIQTYPLCRPVEKAFKVPPISRATRNNRRQVRRRLNIDETDAMVLVSMGGVPDGFGFLSKLPSDLDAVLVIPGSDGRASPHPKVRLLDAHCDFYHPDLMTAADALVGKAGYSTVAEACQSGLPFGYVRRPRSPESDVLEAFINRHLPCRPIAPQAYADGAWITGLAELLRQGKRRPPLENGAHRAAQYIYGLL